MLPCATRDPQTRSSHFLLFCSALFNQDTCILVSKTTPRYHAYQANHVTYAIQRMNDELCLSPGT